MNKGCSHNRVHHPSHPTEGWTDVHTYECADCGARRDWNSDKWSSATKAPWKKEPRQWVKRLRGHDLEQKPEIYYLESPTLSANGCEDVIQIEVHRHYRGSPAHCFNGADDWPHLTLRVPFQVGEEPKRLAFVQKLQKFIEENL